jgi:hypothetical protein
MHRYASPHRVLYAAAAAGFALFVVGVSLGVTTKGAVATVIAVSLQTLGSAILFPILISFTYDRLRERWFGEEVWRLFTELSDAGIARVYSDRELTTGHDNAQVRLADEFRSLERGSVLMMGVTLRVFFNQLGPFYRDLCQMLRDADGRVAIQALICDPDSAEARQRADIEEPNRSPGDKPQILRDIESSVATARNLSKEVGEHLTLRQFTPAPYCTAVIFPHVAYFSPNILAPEAPVRLPMVLFRSGSHGYKMVHASFEFLWNHGETRTIVPEPAPARRA